MARTISMPNEDPRGWLVLLGAAAFLGVLPREWRKPIAVASTLFGAYLILRRFL